MDDQENSKPEAHYDAYDYSTFWGGRDYENLSDRMAVTRLLRIVTPHDYIIDVGGGLGRLVPCYIDAYQHAALIDPSSVQLKKTQEYIGETYPNLSFIQGTAERLPLPDQSVDTILCVRVSHHIPHIAVAFAEYHRVLRPGGYVIMEIANKLHVKSRMKAFFTGKGKELASDVPVAVRVKGDEGSIPFVNHNPKNIARLFTESGFEIVSILSASNFRSGFLKSHIPLSFLLSLERLLQGRLGSLWFGPSIYFLVRKENHTD